MKLINYNEAGKDLQARVWDLYASSFPEFERRTERAFAEAAGDKCHHTKIAVNDNGELLALLFYWIVDDILYVEYIAVNPEMRGQNLGTRILENLIEEHKDHTAILEIDPPVDDISVRRLHFYERLGFVANDYHFIHPSYATGENARPHRLVILSHGRDISQAEFDSFMEMINSVILKYVD